MWCVMCVLILTPSPCSGAPAKTKQVHKLRKWKRSRRIKGGLVLPSALSHEQAPRSRGNWVLIMWHTFTLMCTTVFILLEHVQQKKSGSYFVFPSLLLRHCWFEYGWYFNWWELLGADDCTVDKSFLCERQTMERVAHSVLTDVHAALVWLLEQEVLFDESRKWTPGGWAFCFNGAFFH